MDRNQWTKGVYKGHKAFVHISKRGFVYGYMKYPYLYDKGIRFRAVIDNQLLTEYGYIKDFQNAKEAIELVEKILSHRCAI